MSLHDSRALRLARRFRIPASTVQGILARKPCGQGDCDTTIRRLAGLLSPSRRRPRLGTIAEAVEKKFRKKLPTGVIRAWLPLEPGPDYLREHEARAAERAARRTHPPVPPEIREVRRTLTNFSGTSIALIEIVHQDISQDVLESEYARAPRGWLYSREA